MSEHHGKPEYAPGRPRTLLRIADVAQLLGIGRTSVYRLIASGDLHPIRVQQRRRFRPEEIDDYLERNREPT